ncbi:MAG TPA: tRNA lysidine(34) synthetase TilS [Elusimicrobiales bacterium]|nr:tRNA lysidine(34) synthetase TilS [Elusimicrobiales bacterium]
MPKSNPESNKSFCAKVWGRLLSFSRSNNLLEPGDIVLAGVSGGPDSVCLLHFLKSMEHRWGLVVVACHVHHGLRAAANRDERFVQKLCGKLRVPLFSAKVKAREHAKAQGLSLEHAARQLRYAAFLACARKINAHKVAVGHHLDDQVETFLLHLLRGCAPAGLCGMPVTRALKKGVLKPTLVRPLMCLSKEEILQYLKTNGLPHIKDESNENNVHTRNWIRKKLLPLFESRQPRFRQHVLELSHNLSKLIS